MVEQIFLRDHFSNHLAGSMREKTRCITDFLVISKDDNQNVPI